MFKYLTWTSKLIGYHWSNSFLYQKDVWKFYQLPFLLQSFGWCFRTWQTQKYEDHLKWISVIYDPIIYGETVWTVINIVFWPDVYIHHWFLQTPIPRSNIEKIRATSSCHSVCQMQLPYWTQAMIVLGLQITKFFVFNTKCYRWFFHWSWSMIKLFRLQDKIFLYSKSSNKYFFKL